ncbi:MAG TPA: hypothetical protein ENG01_00260 [Candidatus Aenigmarchaeota archaeon]|nr:MAG: hypothetical protein DRN75_00480 [Nanoarchaeota archaeon]HDO79778.1 hypothetical protein [Candidatus Aenigmarchaeota archaeon]HEX32830.1 hypothetical protein [Candidatus Aenigmarchaeota archaeon]
MNTKIAIIKAARSLWNSLPILVGVVMLIALVPSHIHYVFTDSTWINVILGDVFGSISAGNPLTSYVIGGELLKQGISLYAVTAFLVAWVTVGIIQLPAESILLSKKFAVLRNVLSFIFAMVVAIITVYLVNLL